jgi:DNA-binding MarR family transcriptional regulator
MVALSPFENDIEILENAVRLFAQTLKRPQRWASVVSRAKVDLDRPSALILQTILLNGREACRVQDLALRLGIEPPSVTRKTQELEQDGYLRRVPDPDDRRAIDLRVTGKGRSAANRLWNAQRTILAEALEGWTPSDRQKFVKLFEKFSNDLAVASLNQEKPGRQQTNKRSVRAR